MTTRKGLGKGMGCGYKNLIAKDPMVHRMAAKGMKQPQRISPLPKPTKPQSEIYTSVHKEVKAGNTVMLFGSRLYIWDEKKKEAFTTRHITEEEYESVKPMLKGAFRDDFRWFSHDSANELRDLMKHQDEMTTSDLQGAVMAIAMKEMKSRSLSGGKVDLSNPDVRNRLRLTENEMLEFIHQADKMEHSVDNKFKVRLFYGGKWNEMYGNYSESQIDLINKEMAKPKHKRNYVMGIQFSEIDSAEVKPDKMSHSVISISDDELREYEVETGKRNLNDENDRYMVQRFTEDYQKGKLTVGVDNDIKLWKKLKSLSPRLEAHTWSGVKHVILDDKYLLTFDGSRFKGINRINPKTLRFFTNGQIIKGYRKPNKKDLAFFDKVNAEFANPSQMSHSQGGAEYIAMGAGKVLGGAGEVLGGAGQAIGGLGQGAGRAVGGLGEGIGTRIGEGGKQRTIKEEREYLKDVDVLEEHRLERAQKLNALNQIPTPVRSTVMDSSDTIRRMELQAEMEREMARQAQRDKERQEAEAEAQRKKELLLYGRG